MDAIDPRVLRSREYIDAAFVALVHRRSYDAIRVSDIVRKAGVGRATFYAHYETKHALLASQLERSVAPRIVLGSDGVPDCTALFEHIASAPGIYRGLMSGASVPIVSRLLRACFETRLMALPLRREVMSGVPGPLARRAIASVLLAQVEWWLEQPDRVPPATLQRYLAATLQGASPA